MKIEASHRLKASQGNDEVKSVLKNMGVDLELINLKNNSSLYEVTTPTERSVSRLTRNFGQPKQGNKGATRMWVWDKWSPDIGIVLEEPAGGPATLELYDI